MTVDQLIKVLKQVEDKSIDVHFVYDSRYGGEAVHSVYLDGNGQLIFCEEHEDDYLSSNPNYYGITENQYRQESFQDSFAPDYWYIGSLRQQYPDPVKLAEYLLNDVEGSVKRWRKNQRDTENHTTLFVEKYP